jgi:putative aminopeptidase FrvX
MNEKFIPYIPNIEKETRIETIIEDLKKISDMNSLSGQEKELSNHLKNVLEGLGMKCSFDAKGNLWAESEDPKQKEILLCAHMDKVGPGKELSIDGDKLTGRLDNAIGLSVILQLARKGFRPSILFTVEEESQIEIEESGITTLKDRDLPDGIYNAGARYAAQKLAERENKPKISIVVDTTQMGKLNKGPIIYTSSGLKEPGKQFYFPSENLKNIAKIINPEKPNISYLEGNANDAIEFTFVPNLGVLAIEIPIENNHSDKEVANINDIRKASEILEKIITNADKI